MNVQTLDQSPQNHRGGQVSHLLLAPGQFGAENVAITWVEGQPGSEQPVHSHPDNEQVYVIVRGLGVMTVGEEAQGSRAWDCHFGTPKNRSLHSKYRSRTACLYLRDLSTLCNAA